MSVGLTKAATTIQFLYRHSAVTESLLASYAASFWLAAILSVVLPSKNIAYFLFILPSVYLFLIARIDQTPRVLLFYHIIGVNNLAQVVTKIIFLQFLINTSLIFLLLLQMMIQGESNIMATLEASFTTFIYIILTLSYRQYRLLLIVLGITLVPLSYIMVLSDALPSLLVFNSNCIILLLILISESYGD